MGQGEVSLSSKREEDDQVDAMAIGSGGVSSSGDGTVIYSRVYCANGKSSLRTGTV